MNEPTTAAKPAPSSKMFPVRLLKHYRPKGKYEVVGDRVAPPMPGVDFPDKIWAGTVINLPIDEARALLDNEVVVEEVSKAPNGDLVRRHFSRKFPLAERADEIPVA